MRLICCLLLPTDIRACLYEPGMGESGGVQAGIEARRGARETHDPGQPAGPLMMVETRGHCVVHCHRLIRQHNSH